METTWRCESDGHEWTRRRGMSRTDGEWTCVDEEWTRVDPTSNRKGRRRRLHTFQCNEECLGGFVLSVFGFCFSFTNQKFDRIIRRVDRRGET